LALNDFIQRIFHGRKKYPTKVSLLYNIKEGDERKIIFYELQIKTFSSWKTICLPNWLIAELLNFLSQLVYDDGPDNFSVCTHTHINRDNNSLCVS